MRRALILLACALTTSPALAANRAFPVSGFDSLRAEGPYVIRVRTGARPSVNAHGPQKRLDRLIVEQRGGTLVVSTEKGGWMDWGMGTQDEVIVDITVPMLKAASLTGSGSVTIDRIKAPAFESLLTGSGDVVVSQIETGQLTATITGSGDMTLTGRAARTEATVRGSGDLRAQTLSVDILAATVTGSGDVTVGPARQASVSLTGSGDVTVAGRPKCAISKRGSGDVRCGG